MEMLILLTLSEVLVHGHLASLFWACGKAECLGREHMVKQSCLLFGAMEASRGEPGSWYPFQGHHPLSDHTLSHLGPPSKVSTAS